MTIEECIEIAERSLKFSDPPTPKVTSQQVEICNLYARIAQAAALTAQAMMAAEQHKVEMMRHQVWIDNTFGEIPGDPFLDTVISEEIAADFAEDTSL